MDISAMAPSRGLQLLLRSSPYATFGHQRAFTTTTTLFSGHNRWSKIKHDKGRNDAAKHRQRSIYAQEIAAASKMFGPDPNANPRLADVITRAKRDGFAKASIEAAIARGQGRSVSGTNLESVTVEGLLPHNVAVIVECETDNRARTLMEVRLILKEAGGAATPSAYLFQKRGRILFERKAGVDVDDVLEPALEAGALDVEQDEDGGLVVFTAPEDTKRIAEGIGDSLGLQVTASDILWEPNSETKVGIESQEVAQELTGFLDKLQDRESSVQTIAMNVDQGGLPIESWQELQSRICV